MKDQKKADERRGQIARGERNLDDHVKLLRGERRTFRPEAIYLSEDSLLKASLKQGRSAGYLSDRTRW